MFFVSTQAGEGFDRRQLRAAWLKKVGAKEIGARLSSCVKNLERTKLNDGLA